MLKKTFFLILIFLTIDVNAGLNGVTHHSRANCMNNESISWDYTENHFFSVLSQHINKETGDIIHAPFADWEFTWKSAAVHWFEGFTGIWSKWAVHGLHWMRRNMKTDAVLAAQEFVTDCSIYDGWWDVKKGKYK